MIDPAIQRYLEAWNARDGAALAAALGQGRYLDPGSSGVLDAAGLAAYAQGLWGAFPDLAFTVEESVAGDGGRYTVVWRMRGTNLGPLRGLPPTGKSVDLSGIDLMRVADGRIAEVRGWFDTAETPRQLGLQVLVQPQEIGPFTFGYAVATRRGAAEQPGAVAVTRLRAASSEAFERVRRMGRAISTELLATEGFLGGLNCGVGRDQTTVTAWTTPEHAVAAARRGQHAEAMRAFWAGGIALHGVTSVWVPHHIGGWYEAGPDGGPMRRAERGAAPFWF